MSITYKELKDLIKDKPDNEEVEVLDIRDQSTKDQIALIMMLKGTPKQQQEALEYAGIKQVKKGE